MNCVDEVHEKSEPQVLWPFGEGLLRAKQKLVNGFCGFFFTFLLAKQKKVKG